jgi:hemerythrin-like domain-containing protein
MKRHDSIAALSRDHHFGLLFCWKIRQGIKKQVSAERMQSYTKYFWDHHLQPHFEEEETLLFPLLQDSLVEQALSEHRHIRQLASRSSTAPSVSTEQFNELADTLDNHIRFEERTLFPYMEKTLPADKLAELGRRLKETHPAETNDDYPDAFWT